MAIKPAEKFNTVMAPGPTQVIGDTSKSFDRRRQCRGHAEGSDRPHSLIGNAKLCCKVACLHLDYPRIVEVQAILNIEKYRHTAEVILRCSNHITIKASSESDDMYASIDQVVDRIARKMRKFHTRLMRNKLARRHSVRTGIGEIAELYD